MTVCYISLIKCFKPGGDVQRDYLLNECEGDRTPSWTRPCGCAPPSRSSCTRQESKLCWPLNKKRFIFFNSFFIIPKLIVIKISRWLIFFAKRNKSKSKYNLFL
jgi:hypothetical protein